MSRFSVANSKRWWTAAAIVVLGLSALISAAGPTAAQNDSRTFPETGKTVRGKFLAYWDQHGGLAQQGYPISEEMQEVSDTNGKTYTVQYFERAVFELHPENAGTQYEVLLQLLGVFYYQQKYPNGAPAQQPNNEAGSVMFNETGKRLGGTFLRYWQSHGALPQQGFPISDEFTEVSPLDGKSYKVQYFERAVFEMHPENAGTPYEVLLSQLGTFRYKDKYLQPTPTATLAATATAQPTNTPVPTATARPKIDCSDLPPNVNATVSPNCVTPSDQEIQVVIQASGFTANEQVAVRIEYPSGPPNVFDPYPRRVDSGGGWHITFFIPPHDTEYGIVKVTVTGKQSGNVAVGAFKVIPPQ